MVPRPASAFRRDISNISSSVMVCSPPTGGTLHRRSRTAVRITGVELSRGSRPATHGASRIRADDAGGTFVPAHAGTGVSAAAAARPRTAVRWMAIPLANSYVRGSEPVVPGIGTDGSGSRNERFRVTYGIVEPCAVSGPLVASRNRVPAYEFNATFRELSESIRGPERGVETERRRGPGSDGVESTYHLMMLAVVHLSELHTEADIYGIGP